VEVLYCLINAYCIIALIFVIISVQHEVKNRSNLYIISLCVFVILVMLSDCFTYIFDGTTLRGGIVLAYIANTCYFLFSHISIVLGALFILNRMEFRIKKMEHYLFTLPGILMIIVDILNYWTGWIFNFNENNIYVRGNFYWLHLVFTFSYLIIYFIALISRLILSKELVQKKIITGIIFIGLLPVVGVILQIYFIWVPFTWPMVSLCIITMYILFHNQNEKLDYLTRVYSKGTFDKYAFAEDYTKDDQCLAIFDLDHFKSINDTFGHKEGDILLKYTGESLKKYFNSNVVVGRIGGDEFAVLFKHVKDRAEVIRLIELFINSGNEIMGNIVSLKLSYSAGVCFGNNILSYDELYEKADKALYNRKALGGNGYTIYDEKSPKFALNKPYILIIDSHEIARTVYSCYFSNKYMVIEAEDIKNGLKLLKAYSNRLDCVFIDVNDLNEIKVQQKNFEKLDTKYNIPIIVIAPIELRDNISKDVQIDYFRSKPVNLDEILNLIDQKALKR